jgi:YidC/Oxa1 family membrane protein insertase
VVSAKATTIFGVHLDDKLLFAHPAPSLHVAIVILLTVIVSATTTFMTVRQSAKRGLMQTNMDPDNPMAQSQKFMQYIVPFFSLTGLYWQYGLVLYWVATNLWTLGQQYFMFRNWDTEPVGAEGALGGATTGGPVKTAQNSSRPNSSRPSSSAQASARPAPGAAKTAASGARTGATRPSTASGRPAAQASASAQAKSGTTSASARAKSGTTSASARTGTASRTASTASRPPTGQNGTEKRGLLRLGRAKAEPEPQDDVPTAKVVRQQPVRQAKSKRSGKR